MTPQGLKFFLDKIRDWDQLFPALCQPGAIEPLEGQEKLPSFHHGLPVSLYL
jgi:hypothetical protein